MRLFHALLFDRYMEGTGITGASQAWHTLLPRAERLKFTFVVDTVSGSTPTLSATLYEGAAGFASLSTLKVLLNAEVLTSGTSTYTATYTASDPYPETGFMAILAQLGGGTPKAHVRMWVCGRGERLLARPAIPTSFAAEYQAARMLNEEDKSPGQKRLTRPGSSVFLPPELFSPSAKWEQ